MSSQFKCLVVLVALSGYGCDAEPVGNTPSEPDAFQPVCALSTDCPDDGFCDADANDGRGECLVCEPGTSVCEGEGFKTCNGEGSAYEPVVPCTSADPCRIAQGCEAGACVPPKPKDCDDQDPCTLNACHPVTGECTALPSRESGCCEIDSDCNDGLSCTTDTCDTLNGMCSNSGGPCTAKVHQWGTKGAEDGQLKFPAAVAVAPNGHVVVADKGNHRISEFDRDGGFIRHWAPTLPPAEDCQSPEEDSCPLSGPSGMTVLLDGNLAVADTGNDRVVVLSPEGELITVLDGAGALKGPSDVAVERGLQSRGGLWVVNNGGDNIVLLSLENEVLETFGDTGDSVGKFRKAFAVATNDAGHVFVSDKELNRVQVFDPFSGEVLAVFGQTGSGPGEFTQIGGIAVHWTGAIWVADPDNQRIQSLSVCTPRCSDEFECGSNGCGGVCGTCLGAATCENGQCVNQFPGKESCKPKESPGCPECECEECTCAEDAFCCDTAWDEQCVLTCADKCGAGCPNPGVNPDLEVTVLWSADLSEGFASPMELWVDAWNTLWVVDTVSSRVTGYELAP